MGQAHSLPPESREHPGTSLSRARSHARCEGSRPRGRPRLQPEVLPARRAPGDRGRGAVHFPVLLLGRHVLARQALRRARRRPAVRPPGGLQARGARRRPASRGRSGLHGDRGAAEQEPAGHQHPHDAGRPPESPARAPSPGDTPGVLPAPARAAPPPPPTACTGATHRRLLPRGAGTSGLAPTRWGAGAGTASMRAGCAGPARSVSGQEAGRRGRGPRERRAACRAPGSSRLRGFLVHHWTHFPGDGRGGHLASLSPKEPLLNATDDSGAPLPTTSDPT